MLSLHSLALFLNKTGCTRQFESKLSLHSLALSLNKTGCTRQFESKLSLHSLALFLNKTGCDRQFESKISLSPLVLFFDKRKRRKRFRITLKSVSHSLIRSSVSRFYCYRKPVLRQTCHRKGSPTAPKRLFRTVKMPFPYCETGFPAGRKSLSCNVEKAFINDNDVYVIGLQYITRIAKYCAICIRTDTQPQINGSRGVEVGQICGFVGIAHKKGVYLFYNAACLK